MYGAHSLCVIRAASCYCCCCWKGTHFVWDGVPSSCNLRNFLIHRIITQVLFMGLFQNSNIPQRIQTTIYFHFATLSLFIYSKYLFLTLAYSSSSFIISPSLSSFSSQKVNRFNNANTSQVLFRCLKIEILSIVSFAFVQIHVSFC